MIKKGLRGMFVILCLGSMAYAQSKTEYDKDVSSIENIAEAMLLAISGEKGQERDWKRFENLFLPTAQLNAVFNRGDSSWIKVNSWQNL